MLDYSKIPNDSIVSDLEEEPRLKNLLEELNEVSTCKWRVIERVSTKSPTPTKYYRLIRQFPEETLEIANIPLERSTEGDAKTPFYSPAEHHFFCVREMELYMVGYLNAKGRQWD